uniref:SFRICE_016392 n=1 Tax=Spodoptera frugiperda TaxID=7108 RepID=A0A2H1W7M7_SPOFR
MLLMNMSLLHGLKLVELIVKTLLVSVKSCRKTFNANLGDGASSRKPQFNLPRAELLTSE